MNDIKAGDLVMVVKPTPCCGSVRRLGFVFRAGSVDTCNLECTACGRAQAIKNVVVKGWFAIEHDRLKKIDPPADGDSLPTRKDIEVPA